MKRALQLGSLSTVNMAIGFLFQWYTLTELGPGVKTDALIAGMTIPQLILAVVSGSLAHVLVPLLVGKNAEQSRHDAWGFLFLIVISFSLLAIILHATAPWWVPVTVPGFSANGQALALELTRIQLIGMVFTAATSVQMAAYHANHHFLWAQITPIVSGVACFLLLTWALPRFGVVSAAWITTLRLGMHCALLSPSMGKPQRPDLTRPAIRIAWRRIRPLLFGTAYYKTDPVIDRFLLSNATAGSLSIYFLAQQLYGAATQIVNASITTPLVPLLSKLHNQGDRAGFRRVYYQKILLVGALGTIGLLALIVVGRTLLAMLVGHGNVSASNVSDLWWIMLWMSGVFIGGTMGQISSSAFYARGDTATPTRLGITSYSILIPIKVVSFYHFGLPGLAITTSAFYIVNLLLQHIYLNKRYL